MSKKIPQTSIELVHKASKIISENFRNKIFKQPKEPYLLLRQAIENDPKDLNPYVMMFVYNWYRRRFPSDELYEELEQDRKDYCQKALELEQWDHIYYLSRGASSKGVEYIVGCLEPDHPIFGDRKCECREAVRMVVGQWPKSILHSPYLLDPRGEDPTGEISKDAKEWINEIMKKHYGRDLDKE